MMTPVQSLIRLNPTSAVLVTKTPEGYDPTSDDDFQPGQPTYWPVIGSFSGVKLEGSDYDATLLIDAPDLPKFFSMQSTRVGLEDGEYGIKRVRTRRAFGQISGYSLELGL